MSKNPTRPCADCPYRKDATAGHWHPEEFEKVRRAQEGEREGGMAAMTGAFACHKHAKLPASDRGWCAGWALQQRADGVPSLSLRLMLTKPDTLAAFQALDGAGLDLYPSVNAMLKANDNAPINIAKRSKRRKP